MAAPKNLQDTESLTFSVPKSAHGYLEFLARNGVRATTASDVAKQILLEEVDRRISEKYHDRAIPK